jgi:hypothetical protein
MNLNNLFGYIAKSGAKVALIIGYSKPYMKLPGKNGFFEGESVRIRLALMVKRQ